MDVPAPDAEQALSMTSNAPSPHSFSYIDCDVPAGKTLTEWRREREAARRAERPRHRTWLIAPRRLRWSP
jgi:hypothetical protein